MSLKNYVLKKPFACVFDCHSLKVARGGIAEEIWLLLLRRLTRDGQAAIDAMPQWRKAMDEELEKSLLVADVQEAAKELRDPLAGEPDNVEDVVIVLESSDEEEPLEEPELSDSSDDA